MKIDQVISEIERIQTENGKLLLPNPYSPENNNDMFIVKGFGVAVGAGSNPEEFSYKQPMTSVSRDIGLVFTSKIIGNPQDSGVLKSAESSIRNEAFDLFKEIYNNNTIGSLVTSLSFSSDELQFFGGEIGYENIAFTLTLSIKTMEAI